MSRERFDQTIVQELRQALAIEPSPDFVRQVRARIARPHPWRWQWPLALAAAACVMVVGLAWLVTREPAEVKGVPIVTRQGVDVGLNPEPVVAPKPHPTTLVRPESVRVVRRVEPDVIVPPDSARALARLVELTRSGVVDEKSLWPPDRVPASATLAITPLVVPPIPVPEIDIQSGAARSGARE